MAKKKDTKILDSFNQLIDSRLKDKDIIHNEVKKEFKIKKRLGIAISDSYSRLAKNALANGDHNSFLYFKKRAEFIKNCDYKSLFVKCPTHKQNHLVYARYCKQRLCPLCSFKKSRRNRENLLKLFDFMLSQQDYKYDRYYHLVLTVPNIGVSFDDMDRALDMVDAMYKAFSDMVKNDELFQPYYKLQRNPLCNLRKKKNCSLDCEYKKKGKCNFDKKIAGKPCFTGSIKVFELTIKYSHQRQRWEVHPHFHVLLSVQADFHKHKRRLIVPNNRIWGYIWELYLSNHIDIDSYKLDSLKASKKKIPEEDIIKKMGEPLQCRVEAAYDKKVTKEKFMRDCEEYVNQNIDSKTVDDKVSDMTTFSIHNGMTKDVQAMIKSKLKEIHKAIKSIERGSENKDYKYKDIKTAMAAYEKERFSPKGALQEIGKYTTKDYGAEGIVRINKDGTIKNKDTDLVVFASDAILNGRRLMELTGTFRKAQKYLKLKLEEDIDESDEIIGGTEDCHWSFEDGKFVCIESDATMSYLVRKFDLKYQNYQESLDESDVKVLADYVVSYYERLSAKKKSKNSVVNEDLYYDETFEDDGYDPFTMEISYEEYLKQQKKSDVSSQRTSDS
ncbi:MAG: protein rep [Bifidobacterium adolescentis]